MSNSSIRHDYDSDVIKPELPGSILTPGHEVRYIEYDDPEAFRKIFSSIRRASSVQPARGVMVLMETTITIPDNSKFHAVYYNQDIEGWRSTIESWCQGQGLRWAWLDNDHGRIVLSSGESFALGDCKIDIR